MAAVSIKFGLVLKQQREKIGVSQEHIAFQSGLDRSFVSMLERGKRQPSLLTIFHLSQALSLKPSELVALVEESLLDEPQSGPTSN